MRLDTIYHYDFKNTGRNQDSTKGQGNYVEITKAMLGWLKSISMNGAIRISITRNESTNAEDEINAMFAEFMAEAEPAESAN